VKLSKSSKLFSSAKGSSGCLLNNATACWLVW